jgi:hypothetical protein
MLFILQTLLFLFGTAFVLGFVAYGFGAVLKSLEKPNPSPQTSPPTSTNAPSSPPTSP